MASHLLMVFGGLGGAIAFGIGAIHRAARIWGQGGHGIDPVTGGAVAGGVGSLLIALSPLLKSWFDHRERMKSWEDRVNDLQAELQCSMDRITELETTMRDMAKTLHINRTWMITAHIEYGTPLPDGFGQRSFDVGAHPVSNLPDTTHTTTSTLAFRPPAISTDDLGADVNRLDDGD